MNREAAEQCTILRGLVGSTVHGLNVNDGIEDRDEMGVCVEPLEDAMALWDPFEQFIYRSAAEREGRDNTDLATTSPLPEEPEELRVEEWVEWDYGEYEGRRTADILAERPDWRLFRDGCPSGESPEQVATQADRIVQRVRRVAGDVLLFSSSHFLRVLAARWIGMEPTAGESFMLSTASLSSLSHEHGVDQPAILLWNDTSHLLTSQEQKASPAHASANLS